MAELAPLVAQIRHCWPDTKILVRGDSEFCREQIMAWYERQGIDSVLGLARNARLQKRIDKALRKSQRRCATTVTASPALEPVAGRVCPSYCSSPRRQSGRLRRTPVASPGPRSAAGQLPARSHPITSLRSAPRIA